MNDNFEKVKDQVKIAEVVESFGIKLNRNDKGLCPFHREKTPSFSIDRKTNIFTCFGCGETGDVIKFVQLMNNCTPYEALTYLAETYNIDITERDTTKKSEIKDYIKRCMASVGKTDYFKKRGLTDETIKKYCLGYDESRKVVVIPYSSKMTYYQTRSVEDKRFFKPRTEDAGAEPLYAEDNLNVKKNEIVFVVESPICALSIMQESGMRAVALCGVGNQKKLVDKLKELLPKGIIILSLDRDEAGYEARDKILKALRDTEIQVIDAPASAWFKDPNECLMKDKTEFKKALEEAKQAAEVQFSNVPMLSSAKDLFHKDVPPTKWFVPDFLPQGLTLLVAAPKLGKSYLVLQLCLAITGGKSFLGRATEKAGAMYFALEDEDDILKPRLVTLNEGKEPSADLFYSYEAKRTDTGLFDQMDDILRIYPNTKVFVIDTFQYVRSPSKPSKTAYEGDHEEMRRIRKYANARKIAIILVHHNRKLRDDSDIFNEVSGSQAMLGGVDMAWMLAKKKRDDALAVIYTTSRKCKGVTETMCRNVHEQWVLAETEGENEQSKWRREYEQSEIVKVITEMLKRNPMGWTATANEILMTAAHLIGRSIPMSNEAVGKEITRFETRFYDHGIGHRMAKGRKHVFYYRGKTDGFVCYPQVMNLDGDD